MFVVVRLGFGGRDVADGLYQAPVVVSIESLLERFAADWNRWGGFRRGRQV